MQLPHQLLTLDPCMKARIWLGGYDDPEVAWKECAQGDWMLWLLGSQITGPPWSESRKPILACCLECAWTVGHLWPEKDQIALFDAMAILHDWVVGKVDAGQAELATETISNHSNSRSTYSLLAATRSASHHAPCSPVRIADTVDYAGFAASISYDSSIARQHKIQQCADIIRRHFPSPPKL